MSTTRVSVGLAFCFWLTTAALNAGASILTSDGAAGGPLPGAQLAGPAGEPIISPGGVVNSASFKPGMASNTWVSILGAQLAPSTRTWQESDFSGDRLPTELEGVSVQINGKAGYLSYISPTQINVLVPDDDTEGSVPVQVFTPQGTSEAVGVVKQGTAAAFFMFDAEQYRYVAAVHPDGTPVGKTALYSGVTTRPAEPGDTILLFGNGFGATQPPHAASERVRSPAPISLPVTVRIGNLPAQVAYAGLVGAGLYQFNVKVPEVPDGDQPVVLEAGGFRTQENARITVQRTPAHSSNHSIIIDHTTTDFTQIPDYWIERAKQNIKMYYGHTSHGSQVTNGLLRLEAQYGPKYSVAVDSTLPARAGAIKILNAGTYDWDPDFYPTVTRILSANPQINVVMYIWCGQHGGLRWQTLLNTYIENMQSLERRYPEVTFVYATGNAQEQDCSGCNRQQFNEQLRQFARKNNKVLFDFGDLDVWFNGEMHTYPAPSWCLQYGCPSGMAIPSEHPQWGGSNYNNPCGHATYVSCDNKGKAMWWLLARIAGWDGLPARPAAAARDLRGGGPYPYGSSAVSDGWGGPDSFYIFRATLTRGLLKCAPRH